MATLSGADVFEMASVAHGPMAAPFLDRRDDLPELRRRAEQERDPAHRARLTAALAVEQHATLDAAAHRELIDEARRLADDVGDPTLDAFVLATALGTQRTDVALTEHVELARRGLDTAEPGDAAVPLLAHLGVGSALRLGDLAGGDTFVRRLEAIGGDAVVRWVARRAKAALAFARGDIEPARLIGLDAVTESRSTVVGADAVDHFGFVLLALLRERRRLPDLRPTVETWVHHHPSNRLCRAARAWSRAATGDQAGARSDLEIFFATEPAAHAHLRDELAAVALAVQAAAELGDAGVEWCLSGWSTLAERSDEWLVVADATLVDGPVSRVMALASSAAGEPRRALDENDAARRAAQASESPLFIAHAIRDRGRILRRAGLTAEALDAFADAAGRYRSIGLVGHAEQLAAEAEAVSARAAGPGAVAGASAPLLGRFRREGGSWDVRLADESATIRHRKGLTMLHALIGSPGTHVSATELSAIAEGHADGVGAELRPTSFQDLLDDEAVAAYRRRMEEIGTELARADRRGDADASRRLDDELDSITAELEGAHGLGGRRRTMTDDTERARVRVTKSIRSAIDAIGDVAPGLRAHLDDAITTGAHCSYRSHGAVTIDWEL